MNLQFSAEQLMLQKSVHKLFEREFSTSLVRELQQPESTGHYDGLWKKMAETGLLGVAIPDKYNGGGGSLLDLGIIYEESGKVLVPTTFYSTIFAALVIMAIGTEKQKKKYLSKIANGNMISTVAYSEPDALYNTDYFKTTAKRIDNGWVLSGSKSFVPNAHLAEPLIVVARTHEEDGRKGLMAFLVPANSKGISIKPLLTFGKDRQSVIEFTNVEVSSSLVLGTETEKKESGLELAMNQAIALQCLEMAGGARKIVEMTVKYVTERHQFGVPIGSFQAVQHHLANMLTYVDGAQLLAYQAVSLLSEGHSAKKEVAIAKAYGGEAYKSISVLAHHLWGGMGYATESDLYLWSNRAKATELTFGTRDYHLKKLANLSFLNS